MRTPTKARERYLALFTILAIALAIRVAVRANLAGTIYGRTLLPDEDTYHRWAQQIAEGGRDPTFARDFARLPAIVFAWLYRLAGVDSMHVRSLNVALGVATCAVVYCAGRRLYGTSAGLVATLLCGLSESTALYSGTALNTSLGLLLFAALVALQVTLLDARAPRIDLKAAAVGVCSGLLVNTRGNAAAVGLLVLPLLYMVQRRTGQSSVAAMLKIRRPMVAFAAAYFVTALASGGLGGPTSGFNFYLGNNPENSTPYFQPVRFASSAPESQAFGFIVEASRRAQRDVSLATAERFWIAEVVGRGLTHPIPMGLHLVEKVLAIFNSSPSDNNHDLRIFRPLVPALRFAFLPTWFLIALGCASSVVLPRDRRLAYGAAALTTYSGTIVLFFAGERIRAPLIVLLAPYAGAALVELVRFGAAIRLGILLRFAVLFGVLVVLSRVPVEGADDLTFAYNIHALTLLQNGQNEGARRWYEKSLAKNGAASQGARIGQAYLLEKGGDISAAIGVLSQLPDEHYEAASKYEWLGNLELARRRPLSAAQAYSRAFEIDASRVNAYKGFYVANRIVQRDAAAAGAEQHIKRLLALRGRAFGP